MSSDDWARLLYLGLLGAAVAGWFFMQNRRRLGQVAQQAAVWGLIFLGAIAAFGLWSDIRRQVVPGEALVASDGQIAIDRARDGHYHLTAEVNGAPIRFIVDTGASDIVLTRADALRAGLDPEALIYTGTARTANGTVRTAPVRLETVRLGPFTDAGVRAVVNEGEMPRSLLGMRYLDRFARVEMVGGQMRLTR